MTFNKPNTSKNNLQSSYGGEDSTIGKALDRKSISFAYSSGYPAFLKSNGPFKIYNHHKEKGLLENRK